MTLLNVAFVSLFLLSSTVVVTGCGANEGGPAYDRSRDPETRLNEKSNLPRSHTSELTDSEAEASYQKLLDERAPLGENKENNQADDSSNFFVKRWNNTREKLKSENVDGKPERLAQQRRIGRLNSLIDRDKTDLHRQVIQLWLIQYGELEGKAAEKATEVLQTKIIEETDLACITHHVVLATLVLGESERTGEFTKEHRAALARLDQYYRTGDTKNLKATAAE